MSMVYCTCKNCGKSLLLDMYEASLHGYLCDECIDAGVTLEDCVQELTSEKADQYVVVVIRERDVASVIQVESLDAGVSMANSLLNAIIEEYEGCEDDENSEWGRATAEFPTAWCNYRENWDAHVLKI